MRRIAIAGTALSLLLLTNPVAAQEATPGPLPTIPAADECQVSPRTIESVLTARTSGTPVPEVDVGSEEQLPKGAPADAATIAAVTAVEREFAACYNAAQWLRALALFTDNAIRTFADDFASDQELTEFLATPGTPDADALGEIQIVLVAVRDVRVLPDGRVGAVVEWGRSVRSGVDEVNFHIYTQKDGRWLLDEETSGFSPWYSEASGTPPVWQST
jgi:hypothetical protein